MNEALEKLYRENRQGLYSYALSITRSSQLAEDAIQSGFLGIVRNAKDTHINELTDNAVAYVFRSVRNAAIDLCRSSNRQLDLSKSLFQTCSPDRDSIGPVDVALARERDTILKENIDQLDSKDQEAVVLKLFAGLTFDQAGEVAGVSPKTIATRYRRALDKLKKQLKGKL